MARHNDIGKIGETIACERLITAGCAIIARNWRVGHYEIDIIAQDGDMIVFAEVKTRTAGDLDPLDAITPAKIRRLTVAANAYMKHSERWTQARFDVFGITIHPDGHADVEYIPDAFIPPLKTYR